MEKINLENLDKLFTQGNPEEIITECKKQFRFIETNKNKILEHIYSNPSLIVVLFIGILTIIVGSLSMDIYRSCNNIDKRLLSNRLGTSFAIGFGVGIVLFAIFHFLLKITRNLPILLISIILIAIPSISLILLGPQKSCTASNINNQIDYSLGIMGTGIGILLGIIVTFLPMRGLIKIRLFMLLLAIIIIIFSAIGINTYQKCNKPANGKSAMVGLAIMLTLAIVIFVGVIVSFFVLKK